MFHVPSFSSIDEAPNQIVLYSDFCTKMPCVDIHSALAMYSKGKLPELYPHVSNRPRLTCPEAYPPWCEPGPPSRCSAGHRPRPSRQSSNLKGKCAVFLVTQHVTWPDLPPGCKAFLLGTSRG